MTLITVDNLTAYYENKKIFENMSFKVNEGDYLCITGENGSGKTTLMGCILGLNVKHTGSVMLNGFTRREIGWLPQKTNSKSDFPADVFEVVMSGFAGKCMWGSLFCSKHKKLALSNMEKLEISHLKNRPFRDLSGGQQQKVLLCRALCAAEKVLLLDEPVASLDTLSQNEFYSLVKKLNNSGITVIMISHDVERAVKEAKQILNISENEYLYSTTESFVKTDVYRRIKGEM